MSARPQDGPSQLGFSLDTARAKRDSVLDAFEARRGEVLAMLRADLWKQWNARHEPLSVNDLRECLARTGYPGDPRILGAAFSRQEWVPVGWTTCHGGKAHARAIRTFVPKGRAGPS